MTPLVVIRPQPGCDATAQAALALGLAAFAYPLFEVSSVNWVPPNPEDFDALLIGSANVLRHGGSGLARYRGMPAYAVGEITAVAAREAGMNIAKVGEGGLQDLLGSLATDHQRLLRLTARKRVALNPPPSVSISEAVTYASEPHAMPPELAELLGGSAVVLLHSGEAARHFSAECDARQIPRSKIAIAALGARIAEAAGHGWAAVEAAPQPRDEALLALACRMCQNTGGQDR
ncbi:MAG: uroporphyrinogen-III synthase [Novosphingobium sp.]